MQAKYKFIRNSYDIKLGRSVAKLQGSRSTCPTSCPLRGDSGCYGENFRQREAWDRVDANGVSFNQALDEIAVLPVNSKLRVWGVGDYANPALEVPLLSAIVSRKKLQVLNYTHRSPLEFPKASYVINFSTESIATAFDYVRNGFNAVVVLPSSFRQKFLKTEQGTVVVCPAQYRDVQCENCMLCAQDRVSRRIVVGFLAHGTRKKKVEKCIK